VSEPLPPKEKDMEEFNCYADARRAAAYAGLEFPGTYYLAYRDLPAIIAEHVEGRTALDFGCGTGRSTRFLRKLGFEVVGVDSAENMIREARQLDPGGDYRLIEEGDLGCFRGSSFDLALSAFTFDNVPTMGMKVKAFEKLGGMLNSEGRIINLVSAPEIYIHEWASFSTKDFPENRSARSGDKVKIIITDIADSRPVEDVVWTDESYQETFRLAGLDQIGMLKPLARGDESFDWVNETRIAPWVIYILKKV
jgi:SAM-dependent methyltransferase